MRHGRDKWATLFKYFKNSSKFSISKLIKRIEAFRVNSSDAQTSVIRTRTKVLPTIVAEVTLTDDCRQAVSKELRSKNKQMDGSPMVAIVLLQRPFAG